MLQRVTRARVTVGDRVVGAIDDGLVALVGVQAGDGPDDVAYVAGKIRDLRIFAEAGRGGDQSPQVDAAGMVSQGGGRMNRSVIDVGGAVLVISQFTLLGDCRRGRRPSFDTAAPPVEAQALYDDLVRLLRGAGGLRVETGEFKAMMQVELVNDGPVTLFLDSRRR